MLIATVSTSFPTPLIEMIAQHPFVDAIRFNTGPNCSDQSPEEILKILKGICGDKPIWVDLKDRQLRVISWADTRQSPIKLNHAVQVEFPATLVLRGEAPVPIIGTKGNTVFINRPTRYYVGAGQSANILTDKLEIDGFWSGQDLEYLAAAEKLGIDNLMISFFEQEEDVLEVRSKISASKDPYKIKMGLKIESPKGIEALAKMKAEFAKTGRSLKKENFQIVVARDDGMITLDNNPWGMLNFLKDAIEMDPQAIVASHLFTSLERGNLSAADLSDLHLLHMMGYKNFMLSDGICQKHFHEAIALWEQYHALKENFWGAHGYVLWKKPE